MLSISILILGLALVFAGIGGFNKVSEPNAQLEAEQEALYDAANQLGVPIETSNEMRRRVQEALADRFALQVLSLGIVIVGLFLAVTSFMGAAHTVVHYSWVERCALVVLAVATAWVVRRSARYLYQ